MCCHFLVVYWLGGVFPTATIYKVARKAKCSHGGTKGAVDFRLHYVCKAKEDL